MLELLTQPETWISLATLSAMEVVLGLDNIVFLTILTGRLPPAQQPSARRLGLALALVTRLGLLFAISWVMGLTAPLFTVLGRAVSGRDLILLGGGLFLIAKATFEIHDKLETSGHAPATAGRGDYWLVIAQVARARHRLLARLGHHRGRHGAAPAGHGGGDAGGRAA